MIKPVTKPIDDSLEDMAEAEAEFWSEQELKVYSDIRKIEESNMKFPERKFYLNVVEFLWKNTTFYEYHDSASELLWKKS